MNMSARPSAPNVGRFTGIVLGFVVFVCVAMIGGTGYLKYQLDRAETTLAAPDNALGSDQDMFDRLRRDLGYGGFLGLAQNYVLTHDGSGFAEMKAHIKSADDILAHLPDKTPAETRHELASIVSAFDVALQKINAPAGELAGEFTVSDLVPLYAALPILDARVTAGNAETRLAAQNHMQFWAMLLTLASWCSLIIAAACAAGIYLTLRDKHSAPMRALAQSIQNMARGDMRTAIWGTERQDMIGELARAVDIARYHFSHLPDLSLLSEQGPVRMRFEGGSRSLFEAMMKAISRDSENIREHSSSLIEVVNNQKQSIAHLSEKVEAIMQTVLQRGQNGDREIGKAIHDMLGSAENLKNAHAHAADQLNRLIPSLEDRAHGLSEIAHITGKQIGQTLQSLAASESGMKANAEHAKDTLAKLSSTADDLGERLFGAINLLQASGKVLAETTEGIKGSFGETMPGSSSHSAADLAPLLQRLETINDQLAAMQMKLIEQGDTQSDIVTALEQQREHARTPTAFPIMSDATPYSTPAPRASASLDRDALTPLTDKLEHIASQIVAMQSTLTEQSSMSALDAKVSAMATAIPAELRQSLQTELQNLSAHIEASHGQIAQSVAEGSKTEIGSLGQKMNAVYTKLAEQSGQTAATEEHHAKNAAAQHAMLVKAIAELEAKLMSVATNIPAETQQTLHNELHDLSMSMDAKQNAALMKVATDIESKITDAAKSIPAELRQNLENKLHDLSAHIDATQGQFVQIVGERTSAGVLALSTKIDAVQTELQKPVLPLALPIELVQQMHDHWYQMAAQIEASRMSIDKILQQDVLTKINAFEQTLITTKNAVEATQFGLTQPAARQVYTLPPEFQQQLLDQWFQMSAQLEASRANMVEAIADQIDKMETRMAGRSANTLSKTASDYSTQRQIEQQTQILSELVATLGILDAHMQQIKSDMHASGN